MLMITSQQNGWVKIVYILRRQRVRNAVGQFVLLTIARQGQENLADGALGNIVQ